MPLLSAGPVGALESTGRAGALLDHVRQLVRDETTTRIGVRGEGVRIEDDVLADRVSACVDTSAGPPRCCIGRDPNATEIAAEAGRVERACRTIEWCACRSQGLMHDRRRRRA